MLFMNFINFLRKVSKYAKKGENENLKFGHFAKIDKHVLANIYSEKSRIKMLNTFLESPINRLSG